VIPLRDTIPSRTAPVVTVALIAVNVLVFLHEATLGPQLPQFIERYGLVPYVFVHWGEQFGGPFDPARFLPLFTSMFWHGGWGHLLGNMLYLWIFGDNVEDRLGHARFLLFYVGCGLVAALTQVALSPESTVPTVGASGAIAGVLGAYLISFPRSRVLTLVLIWPVEIPAIAYLVFWFVLQVLSGVSSLGQSDLSGGVAWWAHIGGFLAGIAAVALFAPPSRRTSVRELPL
jgi:membrane associated rhomboid family serine protease